MNTTKLLTCLAALGLLSSSTYAAETLPQSVAINGVEFVHVPGGEFWYGIPGGLHDGRGGLDHSYRDVKAWQDGFYIAKYEARAKDFMRFIQSDAKTAENDAHYQDGAEAGCSVQRDSNGSYFETRPQEDLPITHLSWDLATDFATWLGFRLPTDAEWTKAARGTDQRIWPWGNEHPDDTFAGYNSGSPCHPTPVDSYPNGASPYGAFGMAGGVYEYVQDWHNVDYYLSLKDGATNPISDQPQPAVSDTTSEITDLKVLRGGRWASAAKGITIYARNQTEPEVGFRCYGVRFAVDEAKVSALLKKQHASIQVLVD